MAGSDNVFFVPAMSNDERVQVFRRVFSMPEFELLEVDAYALITDRYLVVCDTFLCPEDAEAMLRALEHESGARQVLVVNSHADWDHAWGNGYFTDEHAAPIIAQSLAYERLSSMEALTELKQFQQRSPAFRNVRLTPPTIAFDHAFTIYGGDLTIELIPAPGHQRDHIAAWLPEIQLLLAFDAVENPIPSLHDAASVLSMFTTLERFLSLQPQHVLCSHGKTTSVDMVHKNLAYLHTITERCRAFLKSHPPTTIDFADAASLVNFPFDEVIAGSTESIDLSFYIHTHNANVRFILQWLSQTI